MQDGSNPRACGGAGLSWPGSPAFLSATGACPLFSPSLNCSGAFFKAGTGPPDILDLRPAWLGPHMACRSVGPATWTHQAGRGVWGQSLRPRTDWAWESLPKDVVVGFYRVTCAEQARHLEGPWVLSSCTQLSFRKRPGARALTQLSRDLRGRGTTSRKASFYGAFLSSTSMPGAPPCAPSSQPLSAGEGNAGTAQPLPALLDKGTQPTRPLRHSPA